MSEFKVDSERICRARGHNMVIPPYGQSSYYDSMKAKGLKICSRCGRWSDDIDRPEQVHKV